MARSFLAGTANLTPVVRHRLKDLSAKQRSLAEKLAVRKNPSAKVTQSTVAVVGGDNQSESQFAGVKRLLRKQNLLGRASPRDIDWSVLAAQRLRKHPGIVKVMQALAVYTQARVHALGHPPKEFLNKEKDSASLKL